MTRWPKLSEMQTDGRRACNQGVYRYIPDPRDLVASESIGWLRLAFTVGVNRILYSATLLTKKHPSVSRIHKPLGDF